MNKADNKLLKKLSNDALGLIHNFFKVSPNPKEYNSKVASLKDYKKGELACFEYSAILSHLLHDAFSIPSYIVSLQFVRRSKNKVTYDGHSMVYPRNSNFYIETTSEKRDVTIPIKEKEFVKALTEGKGTIPLTVRGQEMHILPRLSQKETALQAIAATLTRNRKKIMEAAWKDPTKSVRNNILSDITAPRRRRRFSPNDLQYLHDALIRDHSFFKELDLQN